MKKVLFTICAAAIALAFTGCKEEEQSKLDLNALKGTTLVKGTVYYTVADKDGDYEIKAASGKNVYLNLIYNGEVVKTLGPVTTNSRGEYTFDKLPCNENIGVSVEAYVSFEEENYDYDFDKGKWVLKNFLFQGLEDGSLTPNWEAILDIYLNSGSLVNPLDEILM